jgi:hypothetical protein
MGLPSYANRIYFSASLTNQMTLALLADYALALAPVHPFDKTLTVTTITGSGQVIWSGYIIHTSNTFRYSLTVSGGTVEVRVNATQIATASGNVSTTTSISGLGLTIGQVYAVDVRSTTSSGTCDVNWLGESKSITYTSPPTFTNGVTATAANLDTVRQSIDDLEAAVAVPPAANFYQEAKRKDEFGIAGGDPAQTVWRGSFFHQHPTMFLQFTHGTGYKSVSSKFYYDASLVKNQTDATTLVTVTDTSVAVSATLGDIVEAYMTAELTGTSSRSYVFSNMHQVYTYGASTISSPRWFSHGDTGIKAADLNWFRDVINTIHPGAASPTQPIYYEQAAIKSPVSNKLAMVYRHPFLRYLWNGAGNSTPTLKYGPSLNDPDSPIGAVDLPKHATDVLSYDLSSIPNLVPGDLFYIDDLLFAQQYKDDAA